MTPIFNCAMAMLLVVLVNQAKANHNAHHNHNNNDLVRITNFYDAVKDISTYKDYDHNCNTRINNLRNLLDDSMDQDSFISSARTHCNEYKHHLI